MNTILRLLLSVFLLFYTTNSEAVLTANKVPVVKTGGSNPTLQNGDITDNVGSSVVVSVPVTASLTGNASTATALASMPSACSAGYYPIGIDAYGNARNCTLAATGNNLNLTPGVYINGDLCTYGNGGVLNCNASSAGFGSVTSIATSLPLTGGTISTSGTIGINQATTSTNGYLSSTDWNTFNSKQAGLNLIAGTYVNGDVCTYSSSGTLLNCNTAPSGLGSVTSVGLTSPNSTITVTNTPITTSGNLGADINWTNINTIGAINMSGINWYDAKSLNQSVNWTNVTLVSNSVQTTGAGVGFQQFWNAAKTYFFGQSVNSGLSASYSINWPASAPSAAQIPEVMDSLGNINWVNASSFGGGGSVNWQALPAVVKAYNINWTDMYVQNQSVNWGTGIQTASQFQASYTGGNSGSLTLYDNSNVNWETITAPGTISKSVTWTLPNGDGTANQALITNGSGQLGWGSGSSQWTTSGSNINYTTGQVYVGTTSPIETGAISAYGTAFPGGAYFERNTSGTNSTYTAMFLGASSTGTATTGFGPAMGFGYVNSGSETTLATIAASVDPSNATSGDLLLQTVNTATPVTAMKLNAAGHTIVGTAASHVSTTVCVDASGQLGYCSGGLSAVCGTCTAF